MNPSTTGEPSGGSSSQAGASPPAQARGGRLDVSVPSELTLLRAVSPEGVPVSPRRGTLDTRGVEPPRLNLRELEVLLGRKFSVKPNQHFDVIPGRVRVASICPDGSLEIVDPHEHESMCPVNPVVFADTNSRLLLGRSKLRKLSLIERRTEVEESARSARSTGEKHCGLWKGLSPSEIKEVCLAPGSHHILVMDMKGQLYGKLVYHISARAVVGSPLRYLADFSHEDKGWLRIALKHPSISRERRGQRFMVAHVVATEEALEGRLGMDRAVAYKLAHACMTSKAEGVDFILGIVRIAPATNYAFKAHERVGYRDIPDCLYTYPEFDHGSSQWGDVIHQIVLCDLHEPMQRDLRHFAAHHPQAVFLDLDPLPKPAKGRPLGRRNTPKP